MKNNIDNGFLILYDWLPALEHLSGEELKELLFALIMRQKELTPLPDFNSSLVEVFAKMIEPTIKRRLEGHNAAKKVKAAMYLPIP